jgi:tetratricopeptide (TPR) repeat protein
LKTKSERNELLAEAADTALRKERFSTCLDIVAKLDLEIVIPGHPGFWRDWTSQFLKQLVRSAAAAKQFEIAEKAALGMTVSLAKVQAVAFMIQQWSKAGDKNAARRLFSEAIKIAESTVDGFEKAKAFLLLSTTCKQVDESQQAPLLLSSVKALNNLNGPPTSRNEAPYQEYVRNLHSIGYQVTNGFKELTTKDENAAISLVNQINTSDLRALGLIGVLSGLNDLLGAARD